MLFWGLASREVDEAIELYCARADAEKALADVLADEPAWEDLLFIMPIELPDPRAGASLN